MIISKISKILFIINLFNDVNMLLKKKNKMVLIKTHTAKFSWLRPFAHLFQKLD